LPAQLISTNLLLDVANVTAYTHQRQVYQASHCCPMLLEG